MHRNPLFLLLLSGLLGVTLWFSTRAGSDLIRYMRISQAAQAKEVVWSVEQKGRSDFRLLAHFRFSVEGEEFASEASLPHRSYRNRTAAEMAMGELQGREQTVWYAPTAPHLTALRRLFPVKSVVYALILFGITLYFTLLGIFIVRSTRVES